MLKLRGMLESHPKGQTIYPMLSFYYLLPRLPTAQVSSPTVWSASRLSPVMGSLFPNEFIIIGPQNRILKRTE